MEEILKQAYKLYTEGVEFRSIFTDHGKIRKVIPYDIKDGITWYIDGKSIRSKDGLNCNGGFCSNPTVYENGVWAEIISLSQPQEIQYEIC